MARNRLIQPDACYDVRRLRTWATLLILAAASGCATLRSYQAGVHLRRGDAMLARDDMEDALREFEQAARLTPRKPEPHARLGLIHQKRGNLDQAIDSFGEAVRLDPTSFDNTFSLARLYQMTKRVADAIRAYLYAIELRPNDFDATINLGVCYQQTGRLDQAIQRFEEATRLAPHRPQGYVNLGVVLDAQERHYEAIRAYKEALERDEHQPLVLVNLARTYMNQSRLRMAREALRRAIELKPSLAGAHESLGYCLFRMREFDGAESAYQRALLYDWRLPQAYAGLGSISMLRFLEDESSIEHRDQALEYWHRSLELKPDQPRLRRLIAKYQPPEKQPIERLLDNAPIDEDDGGRPATGLQSNARFAIPSSRPRR